MISFVVQPPNSSTPPMKTTSGTFSINSFERISEKWVISYVLVYGVSLVVFVASIACL